jgi:hypothetical protein
MWWNRWDGDLVPDLDADRRIMPYVMRGRNESIALFETVVDVSRTEAFLAAFNESHPEMHATLFHVVMWGLGKVFDAYPHLNRFVAGGRIYQRRTVDFSFAAKQAMVESAPLVTVKRRMQPAEPFADFVAAIRREVDGARSPAKTSLDRELDLLLRLPGSLLRAAVALVRLGDRLGLLPRAFVEPDPMFASAWLANLGSLKMDAVFHHLYEYGNAAVFCTVGQVVEEPVVRDGKVVVGRVAHLRFSYDERIDDGMYAGHAARLLKELVEDPAAQDAVPAEEPAAIGA